MSDESQTFSTGRVMLAKGRKKGLALKKIKEGRGSDVSIREHMNRFQIKRKKETRRKGWRGSSARRRLDARETRSAMRPRDVKGGTRSA